MDSSIVHSDRGGRGGRAFLRQATGAILVVAALLLSQEPVAAQPAAAPARAAIAKHPAIDPEKLYIDADELVYDKDHNIVTATGAVVLYYRNRILQADKVVYDRNTKRVLAEGRTKFTDERGNVTYAPKFDLTDDFASGFAEGVQTLNVDKTRFSSARIERNGGDVTTFYQGLYTACEPCKAHPDWPPQWQVRAGKIIEDQQTHTIYFENAWMDIYGVPVAYIPYFSAPDPSVTRQSGFMAPIYMQSSSYGYGVGIPYFFNLAPNYDLTVTPMYYTEQGAGGDVIWRQRLEHGEYSIALSGVDQTNPSLFAQPPEGAGNLRFRGSAQSEGKFYLNDKWTLGWDVTVMTDPYYINDYKLLTINPAEYYFQDIVSQVYLRGQDGRGFFDLSGYHFETTTPYLDDKQDPTAVPVFDYHRTFAIDPSLNYGLGGEVSIEANAANVHRTEALYQAVGLQQFDSTYNQFSVCPNYTPGTTIATTPASTNGNCLLRGIAGDYTRATTQIAWQTKYIDPIGEIWQPFVFARVSGEATELDSGAYTYGSGVAPTNLNTIPNYAQPAFFNGQSSGSAATGMAGVGLEYRYPFVSNSVIGKQVIEPIAQLIARPDEVVPKLQPNEDAQSLVFDDTNLFAWSKYSGYDRVEGGTRLNYGLQYTDTFANGGHANVVGGESIQLAGENSYTVADAANTGLDSGLDKQFSNYVAGETIQPFALPITVGTKQQLDSSNFSLARFDSLVTAKIGNWTTSVDYARYAPQPLLGWLYPREGLQANANYKAPFGLTIGGGVNVDMSRHYYDAPGENTSTFLATGYNFKVDYDTTCILYELQYLSSVSDPLATESGVSPPVVRDQTFLFTVTFKTLGDVLKVATSSSSGE